MSNRNSCELEYYELMVSNAFPYIGEKIFTYLDFESLLNCTFVCQIWKEFVDRHENWWLKALQEVKIYFQTQEMDPNSQAEWLKLLQGVQSQSSHTGHPVFGVEAAVMEEIKEILLLVKTSNEHSRSTFWYTGSPNTKGIRYHTQQCSAIQVHYNVCFVIISCVLPIIRTLIKI